MALDHDGHGGQGAACSKRADESDEEFAKPGKRSSRRSWPTASRCSTRSTSSRSAWRSTGEQQQVYLDMAYTAVPGTKLAEELRGQRRRRRPISPGSCSPRRPRRCRFAAKIDRLDARADRRGDADSVRSEVNKAIDEGS